MKRYLLRNTSVLAALVVSAIGCGGNGAAADASATAVSPTMAGAATTATTATATAATVPGDATGTTTVTSAAAEAAATAQVGTAAAAASTFGAVAAGGVITVDSGAGLVFQVNQTNGNVTSIRYNGGPEMQNWEKGSHIASGLGSSTVVTFAVAGGIAKVTLTTPTLTHYLLVRQGENNIYMATYTTAEPGVGELRWITRLNPDVLTTTQPASNLAGNTGTIESKDVFGLSNGETRSKYFGNQRAIDLTLRGATGSGVGVFMVYGNRESSSGGPFYNDIQFQSTEIYNYMNSGHNQTEPDRMGLHGPYVLMFTSGATPTIPDMGWMEGQSLLGWVNGSARGSVSSAGLNGKDGHYPYTVGFSNAAAQYWTKAATGTGAFSAPAMKPGTYTMTVYKNEYEVYAESVTVTAGNDTVLPARTIVADPSTATALWRIGDWDGTPNEFLNRSRLRDMHPSDIRQSPWATADYVVGTSTPATGFSPYQFRGINSTVTIKFTLTASQIGAATLRAGITVAQAGGRPNPTINGWSPKKLPAASSQPDSRSITLGSYRGNNTMYSTAIPAGVLVVGENTLTLSVLSGSAGSGWLAPAYAYDAIDLIATP